jgi:glycosyltransferase involved in cell wall biosynthesis
MISVIVPALNEKDGISVLYRRVTDAARSWNEKYELIIVDDGSTDGMLDICEELAEGDPNLRLISFSRNFGHQAAITAGLQHCSGDIAAVIDADLQDPPEELARFIEKCREGFDVVYAIRTQRKESALKRFAYFFYYRMLKRLAALDIPLDAGDFCVMSRPVVDALNRLPERSRFLRGLRTWVGYRQTGLAYERQARHAGEPKYTFRRLLHLAMDGIINFSYKPLHLVTLAGAIIGLFSVLGAIFVLIQYSLDATILGYNPRQARGWTSLILSIQFLSGIQLLALGIVGEYIGRLFEEIKGRPAFIVRKLVNFDSTSSIDKQLL